ncbi:hypothetical protein HYFRA_00009025 [Hymenoscyphus fraxineus]|uniref:Transmembrane protein 53 n=1 Tax=Hymenoscyphus fraxineus TaxID=746836 RepID=A0A9N9KRG6_9HELO|nr:hypothetical protein HYFRA_00009025 [Hymenoscyphus fraxineus]
MSSTAPAPSTTARPLSFMKKLGSLVFLYQPPESSSTGRNTKPNGDHQPRLIIIAGWTDAKDAHIAKYVVKYQALYPAAQILLLKSTMSCILRPSQIGPAVNPGVSVVRAAFQTPVSSSLSPPPLLIHIFSNGGSSSIAKMYEEYAATAGPNEDKRFPPHVTVFDSCPGLFRIPCAVNFISVGLSSFQKIIAIPLLYIWAVLWSGATAVGLLTDFLSDGYKLHNNDKANTAEIRRAYIYSAADKLTDYKDVEAHAARAEGKGFSVALEKYQGSTHIAHSRKDESRYWDIIKRTMEG